MTQIEWQQLEATVARMTDAEKQRLATLIEERSRGKAVPGNPSLGLFADAPELVDELMRGVYDARENAPLRTPN